MLVYSYKSYPCAPKATALSALCTMGEIIAVIVAAFLIGMFRNAERAMYPLYQNPLALIGGIVLIVLAAACYFFVYRKLVPAMAEKETDRNIRTVGKYAAEYCRRHPEAYERLMAENADFAQHYTRDPNGSILMIQK